MHQKAFRKRTLNGFDFLKTQCYMSNEKLSGRETDARCPSDHRMRTIRTRARSATVIESPVTLKAE